MPTYDLLVADALVSEFTNDNPRTPVGFRIVGPADGPAGPASKRFRVQDDNAPAWTEGKLISPVFKTEWESGEAGLPTGNIVRVVVTDWIEDTSVSQTITVEDIKRLTVRPDEMLLVTVPRGMPFVEIERVKNLFETSLPVRALVKSADIHVEIVRAGPEATA